jgi:hypothetical protein
LSRPHSDRSRTAAEVERRVGYDFAHAVVDDHWRLAYAEIHADERAQTCVAFLERALAFRKQGRRPMPPTRTEEGAPTG